MSIASPISLVPLSGQPLVSIVTVVYNGERLLERTIQSVLNQSYSNLEYIIIDGGSSDGTVEIIRKHEDRLAYWISEPDKGISNAFNKGLAVCKGELIGMINADDWYPEKAVELAVVGAREGEVVYGNLQFWEGDSPGYHYEANHHRLHLEMTLNHPATFARRELYQKFGTFDENLRCAMDYDLLLRFLTGGARFQYVNEVLANMQDAGISDLNWKLGCQEVRQAKDRHLGHPWKNRLWYWKQTASISLTRSLDRSGLAGLLRFYRKWLAPVPKTKAE